MEDATQSRDLMEDVVAWAGDSKDKWATLREIVKRRYVPTLPFSLTELTPRELLLTWVGCYSDYCGGLAAGNRADISFYKRAIASLVESVPIALSRDPEIANVLAGKVVGIKKDIINSPAPLSNQDKQAWIRRGVGRERLFLELRQKHPILQGIAPSGEDKYVPEFVYQGQYLDLKSVYKPFYRAGQKYGVNPDFAVPLNVVDVRDCNEKYPGCQIVFWVRWDTSTDYEVTVNKQDGVWFLSHEKMNELASKAHVHTYQERTNDTEGNARDSYILDLRHMERLL